jgi:hypothetical protein
MDRAPPRGRAEQGTAPDCLQRLLRSRFRQQVSASVRLQSSEGGKLKTTLVLSLRARTQASPQR